MYDLNQPQDVIAEMRDGEMSDQDIMKVCLAVIEEIATKMAKETNAIIEA